MQPEQLPLAVRLRDDATFANFYPGANAAALGYVERLCLPGQSWMENLIWLWGSHGSGRSHLLQAACLHAQEQGSRALYLPLAEFHEYGTQVLEGVEDSDLVALDDVDLVLGQPQWEQHLFHLFNRLHDSGKAILFAAAASPRELPVQLADLQSRLNLALIFHLQQPSDEEKLRILQLRASRRGLYLADEVGRYLLTHHSRSMGDLFVALEELDQASLQAQRRLTIPFVKQVLAKAL